MAAKFNWEDPFHLEGQLSDDERAVRDAARDYCQGKLQPRVLMAARHETFDREIMNEMGARPAGQHDRRLRLRGTQPCLLRPGGARGGARGQRLPQRDERAEQPGDAPDPRLRQRGAAPEVPAQARHRRVDRLLRPHRAQLFFELAKISITFKIAIVICFVLRYNLSGKGCTTFY